MIHVDDAAFASLGLDAADLTALQGLFARSERHAVVDAQVSADRLPLVALLLALPARALADSAQARLERLAWDHVHAYDAFDRGRLLHLAGVRAARTLDPLRAMEAFHTALDQLSSSTTKEARGYAGRVHHSIANLLLHRGLFADARRSLARAEVIAEEVKDVDALGFVLGAQAWLEASTGNLALAVQTFHRDIRLVEQHDGKNHKVRAGLLLSCAEVELERAESSSAAAADALVTAARALIAADDTEARCRADVAAARVAVRRGDGKLAEQTLTAARTASLQLEPGRAHFEIDRAEGELCLHIDKAEEAASYFERALQRLTAMTTAPATRFDRALLHLGLADCAARRGDAQKEAKALRNALHLLDGTDAHAERKKLEQRLARLSETELLVHQLQRIVGANVEQVRWLLDRADGDRFFGERREVVVLFSDLRGFTSLAERIDGDVLVGWLNRYLGTMAAAVEHHGGVVDKFIGDAVMAIFGLSSPAGAAGAALDTALLMHEEGRRLNADIPLDLREAGLRFEAGVGVHVGDVHVGLIGSAARRSFTAIGDVVNTASRLESLTKKLGARVVASDAVVARARRERPDRFVTVPLGCIAPAGRVDGVWLHDVIATAPALRDSAAEEFAADAVDVALRKGDRDAAKEPLQKLLAMTTPRRPAWEKLAAAVAAGDSVVRLAEK